MQDPKLLPTLEALRKGVEATPKVDLPGDYDAAPLGLFDQDLAAARAWFLRRGLHSLGSSDGAAKVARSDPEIVWSNMSAELKLSIVEAIAARRRELTGA